MTSKLWPQTSLLISLWAQPDLREIIRLHLLSTDGVWDLDQKKVQGQLRKLPYPFSLHFNLCLLRAQKGELRKGWVRGKREKGREKEGGDWLLIIPTAKRRACLSCSYRVWSTSKRQAVSNPSHHNQLQGRRETSLGWLPREALKSVTESPAPCTQNRNPSWAQRFNTFPLTLPSLPALFFLERRTKNSAEF